MEIVFSYSQGIFNFWCVLSIKYFRIQLCRDDPYFLAQKLMNGSDHSDCQSLIWIHEIPESGNIFMASGSWRPSMPWLASIEHGLSARLYHRKADVVSKIFPLHCAQVWTWYHNILRNWWHLFFECTKIPSHKKHWEQRNNFSVFRLVLDTTMFTVAV